MPKILERPSDATLRQLYQELRNCAKVGQQIGASKNTAKRWLQEAGVQVGRGRPPGDDDAPPRAIKRGAPPPRLNNRPPKRRAKLGKLTRLTDLQPDGQAKVREALEGLKEHIALRKVLRIEGRYDRQTR